MKQRTRAFSPSPLFATETIAVAAGILARVRFTPRYPLARIYVSARRHRALIPPSERADVALFPPQPQNVSRDETTPLLSPPPPARVD
jgi:hypothetical protein